MCDVLSGEITKQYALFNSRKTNKTPRQDFQCLAGYYYIVWKIVIYKSLNIYVLRFN